MPLLGLESAPGAAYRLAFLVVGLVSLIGMLDTFMLPRGVGEDVARSRPA